MRNSTDYKCIAIWGRITGSYGYYIKEQQALAAKDNAPLTAIYKRENGEWATAEQVKNEQSRYHLMNELAKLVR
jgi:hypothetical protein